MRTTIVGLLILFGIGWLAIKIDQPSDQVVAAQHAQEAQLVEASARYEALQATSKIHYVKDQRTNPPQCFAYFWGGGMYGGPALATVPCESIPDSLLAVAK